jgi:hypothetical protein
MHFQHEKYAFPNSQMYRSRKTDQGMQLKTSPQQPETVPNARRIYATTRYSSHLASQNRSRNTDQGMHLSSETRELAKTRTRGTSVRYPPLQLIRRPHVPKYVTFASSIPFHSTIPLDLVSKEYCFRLRIFYQILRKLNDATGYRIR